MLALPGQRRTGALLGAQAHVPCGCKSKHKKQLSMGLDLSKTIQTDKNKAWAKIYSATAYKIDKSQCWTCVEQIRTKQLDYMP